jgi:hypothetical protein
MRAPCLFVYGGGLSRSTTTFLSFRPVVTRSRARSRFPPSFFTHSNHTSVAVARKQQRTTPPSQPRLSNKSAPAHTIVKFAC